MYIFAPNPKELNFLTCELRKSIDKKELRREKKNLLFKSAKVRLHVMAKLKQTLLCTSDLRKHFHVFCWHLPYARSIPTGGKVGTFIKFFYYE